MPNENAAAAFWSYVHEDNGAANGGILRLANSLKKEYYLLTGAPLRLFTDREEIEWGDEWRRVIDGALAETTFFIPVITPAYFNSKECRRELLDFAARAKNLGQDDLLMPILYTNVNDLMSDNKDEVVALVSRMQYADWTRLRLFDEASQEYRTALNALAQRLQTVTSRYVADISTSVQLDDNEDPGVLDLVEQVNDRLPDLIDILDEHEESLRLLVTTMDVHRERIANASSKSPQARFAVTHRAAVALIPAWERDLECMKRFSALTIELHPLVLAVTSQVGQYPIFAPLLTELNDVVDRAYWRS